MAALITVDELEEALGRTLVGAEITQAEYYIRTVSAYVQRYTNTFFTPVEDEVVRQQSDYRGMVVLSPYPIREVGDVTRVLPNPCSGLFYAFDGLDTLYNLEPHTVYDVTISYGYETTPDDIKGVVTEMVRMALANPTNLSQYRVGDVTETYNTEEAPAGILSFAGLTQEVLDDYKRTEFSLYLGPREFTTPPDLPFV